MSVLYTYEKNVTTKIQEKEAMDLGGKNAGTCAGSEARKGREK